MNTHDHQIIVLRGMILGHVLDGFLYTFIQYYFTREKLLQAARRNHLQPFSNNDLACSSVIFVRKLGSDSVAM